MFPILCLQSWLFLPVFNTSHLILLDSEQFSKNFSLIYKDYGF